MKNPKELNAVEFLALEDYVCNRRDSCENCIAMQYGIHNGYDSCGEIRIKEPEKAIMLMLQQSEKIKQKEAAKPPVKTIKDHFLELYPNAKLIDGYPVACASLLGVFNDEKHCLDRSCSECWNRPLEIPVEKEEPCECNGGYKGKKAIGDVINVITGMIAKAAEEPDTASEDDSINVSDNWISCDDKLPKTSDGEVEILLSNRTTTFGVYFDLFSFWVIPGLEQTPNLKPIAWRKK